MMEQSMRNLFTPFNIGKVTVKNRFCMGPMGIVHLQGANHEFTDEAIEYFQERAKGGFGLITIGVQNPDMYVDGFDPKVARSPLYNPVLYRRQMNKLVERCNSFGAVVFCQISMGYGRNYAGLTPSPVEYYGQPGVMTKQITREQIRQKIEQMIECAKLMKNSGVQGVEIHAMHWGYLVDQFAMEITNQRTDEYGGSLDNRLRVCKELVEGIHAACGEDYPVTIRVGVKSYMKAFNKASLTGEEEVGRTIEEGVEICKKLEEMGYAALSLDTGVYDSFYYACPPSYMPRGHAVELYAKVKEAVRIPILAGSRMGDPALCAKTLEEGKADAFVLARPALADPDFPRKVQMGKAERIRPCIGCNFGCIGRLSDLGVGATCAVNPRAMREAEYPVNPLKKSKKIMVIGGGVAGMEAARLGAELGHQVELYEKSDRLGGELIAAGSKPLKTEIDELNAWYQLELKELNVPVYLNTEVTAQMVAAKKPDVAILAVGADSIMPRSIPGIDHEKAVSSIDALSGKSSVGNVVVVVGAGEIGCETAIRYAIEGKKVSLVEALPDIMSKEYVPHPHKTMLKDMLEHFDIPVYTSHKLMAVNDEGALIADEGGKEVQLAADTVVMSIGLRKNPTFIGELDGMGIETYEIGSGKNLGNVYKAVHEAYDVMYHL